MKRRQPARGKGKQFERDVLERCAYYESKRLLTLAKVDPPMRFVGPGRIVFMQNPFLDLTGCWNERDGKAVFLELKETHNDKLGLEAQTNGITAKQMHRLRVWHHAGAISAALWKCPCGVFLLPITLIDALAQKSGLKHLKAEEVPSKCKCQTVPFLGLLSAMRRMFPD